jgi:aspartate-semialdehyde dehydrogenase
MRSLKNFNIAVVGATGLVGLEFLKILEQNDVPHNVIFPVASERSSGKNIKYGENFLEVFDIRNFDFSKCQIALFSPGSAVSEVYAPIAESSGCWVIDNTSFFRMHNDIPLVVPEINLETLKQTKRKIIANPNCSTIQLVMALQPIQNISNIKRVFVATYQSVSGAGKRALDELSFANVDDSTFSVFPHKITKNLIPQIDVFLPSHDTKEEWKMSVETKKIMNKNINISATCVRVPVEFGHSEAVFFELEKDVSVDEIFKSMRTFGGIVVEDPNSNNYQTPIDVAGKDDVFVSRLRRVEHSQNCYQMWVVADNIRKGAALNAIQIAKGLISFGIL